MQSIATPAAITSADLPKDQNPAYVYVASLGSPRSREVNVQSIEEAARLLSHGRLGASELNWSALRYQHIAALRSHWAEKHAAATANRKLSSIRGVLRNAWLMGQIEGDEYHKAVKVKNVAGETLLRGRALSSGEMRAVVESCAETEGELPELAARDAALLAVLYAAGLRRSEAVGLDFKDYNPETGALTIWKGKGNKSRIAYVTGNGKDALDAWISVRGTEPGPLFLPLRKNGRIEMRRLTPQAVMYALTQREKKSGVAHFSPHDLRRSFASDLLDNGADISSVKELMGHASINTTARYDRRGEAAKKAAAGKLHFPYVR